MSIPPEALQKLVQEIESRAIAAQQQINIVKTQISTKQRDVRLLQLTSSELSSLPKETNVYEGVGKMFVFTPIDVVNSRLASEDAALKKDIGELEKRLRYLETTYEKSRENIEHILKGTGS